MTIAVCSDDEFIALWNEHGSATKVGEILGIAMANVHRRRRNLERKHGIVLAGTHPRSPDFQVVYPENGVRVNVSIETGIAIVASDAHYRPEMISTAHRALVVAVRELKPKLLVLNGDALDGADISRHDRIMWEARPTVKQELEAVDDRTGELEQACPSAVRIWNWGNHDMRFNNRLAQHAAQFEGVKGFNLADHFPGWKFGVSAMVNGHTMIKHRWHNGIHATWNNVLKSGTSMITGHLHALQVRPYTDYNGTRYAVDTGTLACPQGEQFTYGEDAPANHRSGFAVLTFHQGRLMPPELLEVVDEDAGLVFFRGQVIQV
jgi:predicted MPP superfamily phosphohydrolase